RKDFPDVFRLLEARDIDPCPHCCRDSGSSSSAVLILWRESLATYRCQM
ncbi:hypothetical protein Tco_0589713, partial [Tanacetum coccineum]